MAAPEPLDEYLERLRTLPFIKTAVLRQVRGAGARIVLRTIDEQAATLLPHLKKTHLTAETVAHAIDRADGADCLLLAPYVGRAVGEQLAEAGVMFMDIAGNCFVNLANRHVARMQGKRPVERATAQKGLRAPAYKALFALLAKPELINATVRGLAQASGVSRQAATDIRLRLVDLSVAYRDGKTYGWVPEESDNAMEMFLAGYATTLRPDILVGRYRTQDADPGLREDRIRPTLKQCTEFRWGGGTAANELLDGYYHGPNTVIHVAEPRADLPRKLKAVPDRNGPLVVLQFPGPLGLEGQTSTSAHPLLVYAELMAEGGGRARETANVLAAEYLRAT